MPKHEKKANKEASQSDAQGLLRRLNNRYDAKRVDTEKGAMKNLDKLEDTDVMEAHDVPYTPTAEMPKASVSTAVNDTEITDDEVKTLFDRYLGDSAKSKEPVGYEDVHDQIVNAEKRAGKADENMQTDVEKNITEAEKYVEAIAEKAEKEKEMTFKDELFSDATGGFAVDIQDAEQLSAYAPTTTNQDIADVLRETRVLYSKDEEDPPVPDVPTDTAMMKAFGLDPKTAEMAKEEPLFDEIQFSENEELASTEEISLQDMGETVEMKISDMPEAKPDPEHEHHHHHGFEYKDASQNKEIFTVFKSKYNFAKVRLVLAAALALLLGLLENITAVSDMFGGNVNFIAVDWVLTLCCAALVFDRLISAAKAIAKFEFDCDSITLFTLILSTLSTGITLFTAPTYGDVYLYNFPFAICVFLNVMNTFVTLRRDVYSFKIVSSAKAKRMLARASADSERIPEKVEFSEYLGEDEDICTIKKADFISSFFSHKNEKTRSKFLLKIFIPECVVFSILFFMVSYFVMDNDLTTSLGTAYASFLMSAPFCSFIAYSYPLYLASRRAYTYRSAIIGDKTHENYDATAVVAFRDEDAFPVGRAKVKSLKLYADRKIENVMYYASSVYSKLGGPLATVFKQATLNSIISSDIEIREISKGGVSAMVDGKNIVIGRPAYMEAQCFETMSDAGDEDYEGQTNKRILYLACEQIIIAKFYVQYTTTSDFLYMVNRLARSGVGTSIRTADPCIDDGLLYSNKMNPEQYPVKVIKGVLPEEKAKKISAKKGGIVSVGSTKDLIKTFLICDKIENVKKINFVLKTVASILGIAVMVLVLFTGNAAGMLSIFPALYQLFWLVPIYFVSRIYI